MRKTSKKIWFVALPSIVVIILLAAFFIFNNVTPISAQEATEYINKIKSIMQSADVIVNKAQDLSKEAEAQAGNVNSKFTAKYFQEVLDKSDALMEGIMTVQVPPQLNHAHLYAILYLKWLNLGLYEVISGTTDEHSELCFNRSELYMKKFEDTIKSLNLK